MRSPSRHAARSHDARPSSNLGATGVPFDGMMSSSNRKQNMKIDRIQFSCHLPDTVPVTGNRDGRTKGWLTIVAAAGLAVAMSFVQSCSASARAGPNGSDVVALDDGQTNAEVLANADTGQVMVHTWERDLKSARSIEARPLTMGTDDKQIQLEPHPVSSDPPGYCSRFYGRADWLQGGKVRRGWLNHSGTVSGRQDFAWNHGWQAGESHGAMWSQMMDGRGPGMQRGGPGGMHRE